MSSVCSQEKSCKRVFTREEEKKSDFDRDENKKKCKTSITKQKKNEKKTNATKEYLSIDIFVFCSAAILEMLHCK